MKITTTTAIAFLLSYAYSLGQSLPNHSQFDWKSSATSATIKENHIINIAALGADKTGVEPCDIYVQMALKTSLQTGAIIYFPAGNYFLKEPIQLTSGQYLAGDGSDKTTLCFDLNGQEHLISASGTTFGSWSVVSSNSLKDEKIITTNNSYLSKGDLVRIQVDDNSRITSKWASGTIGQLTTVADVTDSTITLSDGLRLNLNSKDHPKLVKVLPKKNLGVANLRLIRLDQTQAQTNNIQFKYTQNAVVSGVRSDSCNFAHVNILYSYKAVIENSYFTKAFNYGSGGKGYGVVLAFTSSQCLVQNNIFQKLRHSILFQAGSNGNIIGYNYSKDPYWTGVFSPSDFAGDVVMHGNYPFLNLIEGNIIQNLVIDNSHGINGPGNIFMRNRIENAGIFMNCNPASNSQTFIGNEITGTGMSSNGLVPFPRGLYSLCGKGHYEFANNKNGTILTDNVTTVQNTFYLDNTSNLLNQANLPFIGFPQEYNSLTIPAVSRSSGRKKTIDYQFNTQLGPRFNELKVNKIDNDVTLSWEATPIDECEFFKIYRVTDSSNSELIGTITPNKSKHSTLQLFKDGLYDPNASLLSYYIIYYDFFGNSVTSDTVKIKPDGQIVSISSDGHGTIFSLQELKMIKLYSLSGKLVYESKVSTMPYKLPKTVTSGAYILFYNGKNTVGRKKILVYR